MALLANTASFTVLATDTVGTVKTVAHGLGATPKVAIVWCSGTGAAVDGIATTDTNAHIRPSLGVMISASERACAQMGSRDGAATGDADEAVRHDAVLAPTDQGFNGSSLGILDADATAFDATNGRFVVDQQFFADCRIHVLFLGGSDLTDYSIDVLTEPAATGDQDITTIGFQPDAVLFFGTSGIGNNGFSPSSFYNNLEGWFFSGAAAGATPANRVSGCGSDTGPTSMLTRAYTKSGECIAMVAAALASIDARAGVTAWLSNGFRLNWAERASNRQFFALSLKGGRYAIGDLTTSTGTTEQTEAGVGFQPTAALLLSNGNVESTADTLNNHNSLSLGAAGGTGTPPSQRCFSTFDENAVATSRCGNAVEHDAIYVNISDAQAVEGRFKINAWNADGFTWQHDDADPAGVYAWYLAAGDAAAAGGAEIPRLTMAPRIAA